MEAVVAIVVIAGVVLFVANHRRRERIARDSMRATVNDLLESFISLREATKEVIAMAQKAESAYMENPTPELKQILIKSKERETAAKKKLIDARIGCEQRLVQLKQFGMKGIMEEGLAKLKELSKTCPT